jgi:hypothetical protein
MKKQITMIDKRWTGSGTETNPYEITNQADLVAINEGLAANNGYQDQFFEIMGDITLDSNWTGIGTVEIGSTVTNSPYVVSGTGFAGTLYGAENTTTIRVNRDEIDVNGVGGLVNYLAPNGTIRNLTVTGTVKVTYTDEATCDNDVEGISVIGGVVGYNCGIIDGVDSEVSVECTGQVFDVGGIAGFNDHFYTVGAIGTIRNCDNSGAVKAYEKVGGIVGENAGLIASCSNSGTITPTSTRRSGAGGIAGRNGNNNTAVETGQIWCCYNTGFITSGEAGDTAEAKKTRSSWMGGIAGFQNKLSEMSNGYNTGNLQANRFAGYAVGSNDAGIVDKIYYPSDVVTGAVVNREIGGVTDNGSLSTSGAMQTESFATSLNPDTQEGNDNYGIWSFVSGSYPALERDATAENTGAPNWEYERVSVYLNPRAAVNGDGTLASPFNNLNDAVNAAGIGDVYVMNSVVISEQTTLYDSTTFIRYDPANFAGPMFIIDAPDSDVDDDGELETTYVTFEGATVDGSCVGTLFQVRQGRLRLRGSMVLQNAHTGVLVTAENSSVHAQLELNEVLVDETVEISVNIYGATVGTGFNTGDTNNLILDAFGTYEVRLKGIINLAQGAYITAYGKVSCPLNVKCASPTSGMKLMTGVPADTDRDIDGYDPTNADAYQIRLPDDTYAVKMQTVGTGTDATTELVLATPYFLDGTATAGGSGTASSPWNSLTSALAGVSAGDTIFVTGTTALAAGIYSKDVLLRRGADLTGSLFSASAAVTLSTVTVDGRAAGTLISVASGTLTLSGDANLFGAQCAVDVANSATLAVTEAVLSGSLYSVTLAGSSSNLTLTPNTDGFTRLIGAVYLPDGAKVTVGAALQSIVRVECARPQDGLVVATSNGYTMTELDRSYFRYVHDASEMAMNANGTQISLEECLVRYLDGTTGSDSGTGLYASPYKTLTAALNGVPDGGLILVLGGTTVTGGTYAKDVTIQRDNGFTGTMFTVSSGNAVTLSDMTITGRTPGSLDGTGTVIDLTGGSLTLTGGVSVIGAETAIAQTGGDLTVESATITGSAYSVNMGAGALSFTLASTCGITFNGTIYLASGKVITATAAIRYDLTVESASPAVNVSVIQSSTGYSVTQVDADHIYYVGNDYGVRQRNETVGTPSNSKLILVDILYLDGTKTTNGNGSKESPFNNLASAIAQAGPYKIIWVEGTTALTGQTSDAPTVVVVRAPDFDGVMFTNASGATGASTGKTISGRGIGIIGQLTGGSLDLNGGTQLINCEVALDVQGGDVTISQAVISANDYSIYVAEGTGTLTLNAVAVTTIDGVVYLASGKSITTDRALICDLVIQSGDPANDVVVMECSGTYKLSQADVDRVSYLDDEYIVRLNDSNQLVLLIRPLYVDGTAATNGNGSYANPYNNLADAVNAAKEDGQIYILGTTTLNGSYDKKVIILRGEDLEGTMFRISGRATFSTMTIDGGGTGTIFDVVSGTLTLSGGVELTNCEIAVSLTGGGVTITQAVISATQYSVNVTSTAGTLALSPQSGTEITGAVYLASGKRISIQAALTTVTGTIQVTSAQATTNTIVAECTNSAMAESSVNKLIINGKVGYAYNRFIRIS